MTKNTYPGNFMLQQADPNMAALLSIVPGLGQLYNGEKRKGVLFLEVAAINYFLLWLVIWTSPLVDGVKSFGAFLNLKPNGVLLGVLRQAHWGSPLSFIILGMVMMFVTYAIRDAYDKAAVVRRKKIYPEEVIELTEAASGSYLFHFAAMVTFFILAMFFLVPPPPVTQVTEFEFIEAVDPVKHHVDSKRAAVHAMENQGRHEPQKEIGPSGQTSSTRQSVAHQSSASAAQQSTPRQFTPKQRAQSAPDLTQAQPAQPSQQAASAPHLPTPSLNRPANITAPQPALQPGSQSVRSANAPPLPTPSNPTTTPQQSAPMPSLQAPRTFAAGPAPALPLVAMNPSAVAPPLPVPGKQGQVGGPAFAPVPMAVNRASNTGAPVPRATPGGPVGHSAPASIAPMAVNTGSNASGPSVIPSFGTRHSTGIPNGTNAVAPGPTKMEGGPTGTNGRGPAIAVAPVGPGTKGPSADSTNSGPPGTGTSREGNPKGPTHPDAAGIPDFGKYMADLQRRIKSAWFPPRGPKTNRTVVQFKIHTGGELSHLRLVTSSGDALSDQAALKAVENAAPFRHLPPNADENVDIEFTFDYNVFGGRRQF